MKHFKVGDRVRVKNVGCLGTVIDVRMNPGYVVAEMDGPNVGVEVSQFPGRKVYWLGEDSYEKVAGNAKIVITHDGTTTLARLYEGNKVIKRAEAKCAPGDTFDFSVGASLAYDRLMRAEPEPEYYHGKVVCVRDGGYHRMGRVYVIENGIINFDHGEKFNFDRPVKTLAELNDCCVPQFIEFKGEAQ